MYCRSCRYDLRGQEVPRCPECGGLFSFVDDRTYLDHLPTWRSRIQSFIHPLTLWGLRFLLFSLGVASVLAVPSIITCGAPAGLLVLSGRNLQSVAQEWTRQCGGLPIDCRFDPAAARAHLPPSFSSLSERDKLGARYEHAERLGERPVWFFLPCLFAVLLGLTFRAALRSWILLSSAGTFCIVLGGSCFARPLSEFRYPAGYAYVDDFVYLEPPRAAEYSTCANTAVIAYQRHPDITSRIGVAFANGETKFVTTEDLDSLLAGGTTQPREGFR